jgi:hypothetical protein
MNGEYGSRQKDAGQTSNLIVRRGSPRRKSFPACKVPEE